MYIGAIKEIQNRIPEKCLLLSLGSTSNAVASAVNLTKKLEESSPGLPAVNQPKSIGGRRLMKVNYYLVS